MTAEEKQVTCSAPVNIAVIKYWGKRNSKLLLPTNSSLSVTLSQDHLKTTTTIKASSKYTKDQIFLNGKEQDITQNRLQNVITQSRKQRIILESETPSMPKISQYKIIIASINNFPTAAGLASSASGYACLAFALAKLYNLKLTTEQVSKIARQGSGSACRSLFGGFVKWNMGTNSDGEDSFAEQIESKFDIEALVLVVSDLKKDIGSSIGMQETVKTSSLFSQRLQVVPERMVAMENAIVKEDFDRFAELTMMDSNQFHAVCHDTYPPIFYLNDVSKYIIKVVTRYNSRFLKDTESGTKGYKACYTFDAGPNAVLYLPKENVSEILGLLNYVFPSTCDRKEYFGRALDYLGDDVKKSKDLADKLGLGVYGVDAISRVISTKVGDGPRVLADSFVEGISLLGLDDLPAK
jgi:diphosphomevalonate decarboxylase